LEQFITESNTQGIKPVILLSTCTETVHKPHIINTLVWMKFLPYLQLTFQF